MLLDNESTPVLFHHYTYVATSPIINVALNTQIIWHLHCPVLMPLLGESVIQYILKTNSSSTC